jgi:hypothetical protein
MHPRLRLGLICVAAFCLMGLPAPSLVRAGGPLIEEFDSVVDDELMANCGDFLIIANGSGKNRITTFFDNEGNPIRVAFHGRYRGTMTNSVTGETLLDAPSVANITFDLVAGTQTNIGAFFTVTTPGGGAVLIEAGRIVFDGNGPPIFIAGPHRPPNETIGILCDALR